MIYTLCSSANSSVSNLFVDFFCECVSWWDEVRFTKGHSHFLLLVMWTSIERSGNCGVYLRRGSVGTSSKWQNTFICVVMTLHLIHHVFLCKTTTFRKFVLLPSSDDPWADKTVLCWAPIRSRPTLGQRLRQAFLRNVGNHPQDLVVLQHRRPTLTSPPYEPHISELGFVLILVTCSCN
jgi:hypothetical protein